MATVTTTTSTAEPDLAIRRILSDLRRRISRYVLLEGVAIVVAAAGLFFWITLALDTAWFAFRKLELPVWFRITLLALGLATLGVLTVRHIFQRMFRTYRERDLALVLERRFPELNDGLITAVELPQSAAGSVPPLTQAMLARTVQAVAEAVRKLPMESVFAMRPLRRAVISATVAVISLGGLGVVRADTMGRWWDAFVLHKDSYWDRRTDLQVSAIVQPGDRRREFRTTSEAHVLLHPRNTDLTLSIEASAPAGISGSLPDRIRLDLYRAAGHKRVYQTPVAPGTFRYSIDRLNDHLEFHIQGGDYANRLPYRIRVVDAPRIETVLLRCDYPAYTGWNESHSREINILGKQAELPMETAFELVATTNKPLIGFHLEVGDAQLTLEGGDAVLKVGSGDEGQTPKTTELPAEVAGALLDADGRTLRLPVRVTPDAAGATSSDRIHIEPDSLMRFYLHDADDIVSGEPVVLRILGRPDRPPVVDCELQGVGDAITRKASVPVSGLITDDYGIANTRFEFRVDDEPDWRPRRFHHRVSGRPLEYRLQGRPDDATERFNVTVLGLEEGQRLTLSVYAEDADDLHGPNTGRSQKFEFRIVSNEELLSLLYAREINLRRRFEEVIQQMQKVREDLARHREQLASMAGADPEQQARIRGAVASCASGSLNAVRKNANECQSVEAAFRDIVEELINNAIPPQSLAEEMRRAIVQPLGEINERDFPGVDLALGSYKLASERDAVQKDHFDASIVAVDQMLAHMRILLDEIKDLAELHEIVNDLKQLIDSQQKLLDETKALQKKRLIEKLKLLGGDDDE